MSNYKTPYQREADAINKRVSRRKVKGEVVTADQIWTWIRERTPTWDHPEQEKVFQAIEKTVDKRNKKADPETYADSPNRLT